MTSDPTADTAPVLPAPLATGRGASPCLVRLTRGPRTANPRLRLFLFPYAGGSAGVFREWPGHFGAGCELFGVQLAGRGPRLRERACSDAERLVHELADAVGAAAAGRPFSLLGHSLGAALAYRVARELARRGAAEPDCLFLGARKAPHLPATRGEVASLDDRAFIAHLRSLQGTPKALLEDAGLMSLLLPTLRADFALLDHWQREAAVPGAPAPLRQPIYALAGRHDAHCRPVDAAAWAAYTSGAFELSDYAGGHFFIHSHQDQVIADMRRRLAPLLD